MGRAVARRDGCGAAGGNGGGEGGGDGGRVCGAGRAGGRVGGALRREGILRRRRARVPGRRAGGIHRLAARVGQDRRRHQAPGRRPGPAPRRVGGTLCRARRRQGGHPGPGAHRRVRQGAAGTVRGCCCEQLIPTSDRERGCSCTTY
jgi:hypothetical protein